jgi:hypothetical protein
MVLVRLSSTVCSRWTVCGASFTRTET